MTHYLVTAIVDFIVALIALSIKGNRAAKALSFASLCLGLWSLELYLLTVLVEVDVLSIAFHLTRWGMFFIPPALALLSWMLIGARSKLFLAAIIFPGFLASAALSIANAFFFPSELTKVQGGYLPELDFIFYSFAANFVFCLMGSVIATSLSYRSTTYREKQRIKWLLIILSMTLATGLASIFLVQYDFYLKLVGATTNITFVALLFYATVQHHLMDIRSAISFGIVRAALISAVIWSFFFLNSVLGGFNHDTASVLVTLLFIVTVLEVYPLALRKMLPSAKKLVSKQNYNYEEVVEEYGRAFNSCINKKNLNRICEFLFNHIARIKGYALYTVHEENINCVNKSDTAVGREQLSLLVSYLQGNPGLHIFDETPAPVKEVLEAASANACFSSAHEGTVAAVVLLGSSNDGSYYRYDDIKIFEWLGSELGRVVSRIRQVDDMNDELGEAKKTLSMLGVMNHYHHDIKAPLAVIDGVLSNDIYDKEKQKDIVLEQVERGSKLITTMANILKGERKRKVSPVSLQDVVDDSVFLLSQGLDKVSCELSDVPRLMADAEDLKILVINVIKNAVEARRDGVALVVKVRAEQTETHLVLSFSDTGKGMSESLVERLWEDVESDKDGGSGIGTQAIKRIADEHFADIEVKSKVGFGSEFIFKFPLSLVVDEQELDQAVEKEQRKGSVGLAPASMNLRTSK